MEASRAVRGRRFGVELLLRHPDASASSTRKVVASPVNCSDFSTSSGSYQTAVKRFSTNSIAGVQPSRVPAWPASVVGAPFDSSRA